MVKRKLCYVNTKLRETEVKNKKITKFFFFSLTKCDFPVEIHTNKSPAT